jgi:drug/metabolite transporter (DMT)-like permease
MINGIILTSISAISYAVIYPLLKKAGLNPFATILLQISFLWLSILPVFYFTHSFKNIFLNGNALFLLALAGIINAIGFYASVRAYSYLPIWQISLLFAAISPIIGSIVAYVLLNEPITAKLFIGLAFVLAGLTIALR